MTLKIIPQDKLLAQSISKFYSDPLGHVMFSYPWDSEPSIQLVELEEDYKARFGCKYGPDTWACQWLDNLGEEIRKRRFDGVHAAAAIRMSTASGHGIGKSTLTAWVIRFIMDTRPNSKGVVTANTNAQLEIKTWSELAKWHKLGLTRHWYTLTSGRGNLKMYHNLNPEGWRVDGQTCAKENAEAFQGLHNAASTPFMIFDEASGIDDAIWEAADGGMTDGEPMFFAFGNPLRNTGRFRECWGKFKAYWITRSIDSRTAKITNKTEISQWIEAYGIDSDYVKKKILGIFPSQSAKQFISGALIDSARRREPPDERSAPLIVGLDFARSGDNQTVMRCRRGRDAQSFPVYRWRERDSVRLAAMISQKLNEMYEGGATTKPDAIFGDGGGIGGPIIDILKNLGHNVIEVQFGGKSEDDRRWANKRSEMWGSCRDWLPVGCIDGGDDLYNDLNGPEYHMDRHDRIILESKDDMKKRGLNSPDDGDALCITFAQPVAPRSSLQEFMSREVHKAKTSYDRYAEVD